MFRRIFSKSPNFDEASREFENLDGSGLRVLLQIFGVEEPDKDKLEYMKERWDEYISKSKESYTRYVRQRPCYKDFHQALKGDEVLAIINAGRPALTREDVIERYVETHSEEYQEAHSTAEESLKYMVRGQWEYPNENKIKSWAVDYLLMHKGQISPDDVSEQKVNDALYEIAEEQYRQGVEIAKEQAEKTHGKAYLPQKETDLTVIRDRYMKYLNRGWVIDNVHPRVWLYKYFDMIQHEYPDVWKEYYERYVTANTPTFGEYCQAAILNKIGEILTTDDLKKLYSDLPTPLEFRTASGDKVQSSFAERYLLAWTTAGEGSVVGSIDKDGVRDFLIYMRGFVMRSTASVLY